MDRIDPGLHRPPAPEAMAAMPGRQSPNMFDLDAHPASGRVEDRSRAPTVTPEATRVLRNTYALLSLTLLFSAGIAATSVTLSWPTPGIVLTLAGYFGLLLAVFKLRNRGWALPAVFGLTGFMGYTLGPLLSQSLALPGGNQTVTMALAATGATFPA